MHGTNLKKLNSDMPAATVSRKSKGTLHTVELAKKAIF